MATSFTIEEIAERLELEARVIERCIEQEWLIPADPHERLLDAEDIARLTLIADLTERMGVNEESIPIILKLIDQVHALRWELRKILGEPQRIEFH